MGWGSFPPFLRTQIRASGGGEVQVTQTLSRPTLRRAEPLGSGTCTWESNTGSSRFRLEILRGWATLEPPRSQMCSGFHPLQMSPQPTHTHTLRSLRSLQSEVLRPCSLTVLRIYRFSPAWLFENPGDLELETPLAPSSYVIPSQAESGDFQRRCL